MRPRHAGIDVAVIALWLGHEQIATANIYLHADMEEKERAIARVTPPGRRLAANSRPTRYSPSSTASDCSDLPPVDSPVTHTNPRSGRNNDDVGSIGFCGALAPQHRVDVHCACWPVLADRPTARRAA